MRDIFWWWESAISKQQCDDIVNSDGAWQRGVTGQDVISDFYSNYRESDIKWINSSSVKDMINYYINTANRQTFGVNVVDVYDIQLTKYEVGGHYKWHNDVNWKSERAYDRKLTFVLQLSDPSEYDGGELQIEEEDIPSNFKRQGSIIVFPSHQRHQVTPVISGTRHTLVAWAEGPRWQ